jgi:hypothetical protein
MTHEDPGHRRNFKKDRDDGLAHAGHVGGAGVKALLFASGSAVIVSFAGGAASQVVYDQKLGLPLPELIPARSSANVRPMVITGLWRRHGDADRGREGCPRHRG